MKILLLKYNVLYHVYLNFNFYRQFASFSFHKYYLFFLNKMMLIYGFWRMSLFGIFVLK